MSEYLLLALLLPPSSAGRVWYLVEAEGREVRRKIGVSLKRSGLGEESGLEKGEGAKGGGVWLREVELLRLVLRFSSGVADRRAEEAAEDEEGGRGEGEGRFSAAAEEVVPAEPGLAGAGFRLGLFSEPAAVDDVTLPGRSPLMEPLSPMTELFSPAFSPPAFSRSPAPAAVGLLAAQGWLSTDVAVEQSGSDVSDE